MRLKVNVGPENMRQMYRGNDLQQFSLEKVEDFHIMNEIVLDRGPSPFSVQLDIYFDGNKMTNLLGDGLIIATPTGSTAYSLSAGGSLVQPNTQCICITPLAPHSLSFRPLIVPISTTITIKKPMDNRNSAWVSLDGGTRFEMKQGEELTICGSDSNLGMVINPSDNLTDLWSQRLGKHLGWNQRDELKPLQKQQR